MLFPTIKQGDHVCEWLQTLQSMQIFLPTTQNGNHAKPHSNMSLHIALVFPTKCWTSSKHCSSYTFLFTPFILSNIEYIILCIINTMRYSRNIFRTSKWLTLVGSDAFMTSIIFGKYFLMEGPTATAKRPRVTKAVGRSLSRPLKHPSK